MRDSMFGLYESLCERLDEARIDGDNELAQAVQALCDECWCHLTADEQQSIKEESARLEALYPEVKP